jgi:prepilin-type N-terminal cleavage/methylation domain-containing protein
MRRSLSRRRARGFTLVELMVAMTAGLIVSLAVVALSTQATTTFHEEGRTATAEMSLRTAIERIRGDLNRAAYMSTPNIQKDPLIAHAPDQPNIPTTSPAGIKLLSSIRLIHPSPAKNLPLSVANGLTPDTLEVSGNFTTTDSYVVRVLDAGGGCGGQRLTLAIDSPAMWRVLATPNPDATFEAMFQPVAGGAFIVRVEDDTGHYQFVQTCTGKAAGITGSGLAASAYVDVATTTPILSAADTKTQGGAVGLGVGRLSVNPVQTVRWEVRPIDTSQTRDNPYRELYLTATTDGGSSAKYELFRTYVDAAGTLVDQTELVAEYAVDFKVAFSADLVDLTTDPNRVLTVYGMSDTALNEALADDVTVVRPHGPERIRSVRFRLSTRSSIADRETALVAPAANLQQGDYPLRYCILEAGCTSNGYARVRTTTTEVTLMNQARVFY